MPASRRPSRSSRSTSCSSCRRPASSTRGRTGSRRTCIARGHTVTVVSRHKADLPWREDHPAGFELIRVLATAEDGMPFRGLVRAGRVAGPPPRVDRDAAVPTSRRACREPPRPSRRRHPVPRQRVPRPSRRAWSTRRPRPPAACRSTSGRWMGLYRRLAIPLQIRSHRRNAKRVAPRGDLVHGMAFMGIPVALTVGQARRRAGRLRRAGHLPRCPEHGPDGPAGPLAARPRRAQAGPRPPTGSSPSTSLRRRHGRRAGPLSGRSSS